MFLGSLEKARYDKIVHVRKAMQKAQAAFNAVELVSFDDYAVEYEVRITRITRFPIRLPWHRVQLNFCASR